MKKMICMVCFFLWLFSCQNEQELEPLKAEAGVIVLKMKPDATLAGSRATEPGNDLLNENKIENLHLFFFVQNAADAALCLKYEFFTNLSFAGTGLFAKELTTARTFFSAGVTYDLYTVVNLPADVTIPATPTLGAIKALRTLSPLTATGVQPALVMDGKVSAVFNPVVPSPAVLVDVPLKRAVSKIRVKFILAPAAAVASAVVAQVSLRHSAKTGSLLAGYPYVLTAGDYTDSPYVSATPASTFTFYCYENNWATATAQETYLMVNLPYAARPSNYYRLPVNKYANQPETGRVARNMIYDVTAYIDNNGSESENGTVALSGNCLITDWTTREIILKTITQHYLGISEYAMVMPNTAAFTLNYVSDLPVSITNVTAICTQYSTSGVPSTLTYTSGQAQYPLFAVSPSVSTITINSAIPVNYVPKYITFTVTNNQGLSLNATVVQYPARYVTARASTGNVKPEFYTGGTNLNLFTVNTLVPSPDGSYTLGDPTNGFSKTDSTAIGNKMVSPRFIIASQYGVYLRVTYPEAQTRCFLYGEDIYRNGWRMPTKSEIELINTIQDDPNSAVKALLTGDAYWSAFKYDYYNFVANTWTSVAATGTAYVRAVYDVYKDEP